MALQYNFPTTDHEQLNQIFQSVASVCNHMQDQIQSLIVEASDPEKVSVLPGTVLDGHFVYLLADQHVYLGQG